MENYDAILAALQSVLRTQLLAPSWNALSVKLGTARSIFYRIVEGKANQAAIQNLLSLLHEQLYIDSSSLLQMEAAITNPSDFTRVIKPEMNLDHPEWQFQAILAFILHDYSHFSPDFKNGILQNILHLERTDPQAFFNMLAYFYITACDIKFYKKNLTHKERCAAVIEPLGKKLIDIFPSNGFAAGIALNYSLSDILNAESQTLWSLVGTISSMLQAFASPLDTSEQDCNYRLLPGLSTRSYWKGNDSDQILLLWLRPGREPATGHYELFAIDSHDGNPKGIASLFLLNEEFAAVFIKSIKNSQMAMYSFDDDILSFSWEDPNDDPMQTGNKLTLLSLDDSQSLRELDRSITEDSLLREMARSEGFDFDFAMQPEDVILSRSKLTVILKNGKSYEIDIDFAPFLRNLTPKENIMVCRQLSDDRVFVIWPQIRQSIPLDLFTGPLCSSPASA